MTTKIKLSEKQIREQIITVLNYAKYMAWTNNTGAFKAAYTDKQNVTRQRMVRFSKPGFSDIFAIQPRTGKFVAIEVKTPQTKNDVTPEQQTFIELVNAQGGTGFVAWSIEMVQERLGI